MGRLPIYLRLQCNTFAIRSLIVPLLLYTHFVVTFDFFLLLLVYLHLVSVFVPCNKNTFMLPLSLIICNLVYPRILNYSLVYPFRTESYFLNTSCSNVHFLNVLFNFQSHVFNFRLPQKLCTSFLITHILCQFTFCLPVP